MIFGNACKIGISVSQKEDGQNALSWLLSAFWDIASFLGNAPAVEALNSHDLEVDCL